MSEKILSLIIPYRLTEANKALFDRIKQNLEDFEHENIDVIFVDSSSFYKKDELANQVSKKYKLLELDSKSEKFSPGEAINWGAQHAETDAMMFMSAAAMIDSHFFEKILRLVKLKNIAKDPNSFFSIPLITIPEDGTGELLRLPRKDWRYELLKELFSGYNKYKAQLNLAGSALVLNRHKYLTLGGHRAECYGLPYEDFEFLHRLTAQTDSFPVRATHYYYDSKSPSTLANYEYDGFRAQFSLLGREAMYNGVYLFQPALVQDKGAKKQGSVASERGRVIEFFKSYDEKNLGPQPLEEKGANYGHTLLIDMPFENFGNMIKDVMPYLGKINHRKADFFYENSEFSPALLEDYLFNNKINRVMFSNPYGAQNRLPIYRHLRKINFPLLCFDRGALPESWFFDTGFNFDSPSYAESRWNKPLGPEEQDKTRDYIQQVLSGEKYLEAQNSRIGPEAMRKLLGLDNRKILFVPLQKPDDTVIKYFAGKVKSFDNYLRELSELSKRLERFDWVIVCKRHPLAENIKLPDNLLAAPEGANIMDMLALADAVSVINSGTGLMAAMLGKPAYVWGEAFYANDKMNKQVSAWQEVEASIKNRLFKPDMEIVERFIHYLVNDLYSFGTSQFTCSINKQGYIFKKTTDINFYKIRLPWLALDFTFDEENKFLPNGFAFEIFREDIKLRFKDWQWELRKSREERIKQANTPVNLSPQKAESPKKLLPGINRVSKQNSDNVQSPPSPPKGKQVKRSLLTRLFGQKIVVPEKLSEAELAKIIDTFNKQGAGAMNSLLEEIAPHPRLRADAYTGVARSVMEKDKKLAAEMAYEAWKIHPRPFRQKWLAYRFYDAGDVAGAILLLESLPSDTPIAETDKKKINRIMAQKGQTADIEPVRESGQILDDLKSASIPQNGAGEKRGLFARLLGSKSFCF